MSTAAIEDSVQPNLPQCLSRFVQSANAHPSIAKLLQGWEPLLVIEATDDGRKFHLRVQNSRVGEVGVGAPEAAHAILVRGASAVLSEVFSGTLSPAQAYPGAALLALWAVNRAGRRTVSTTKQGAIL